MAKVVKPTKQQLAQAKLRAAASGIKMDQSAKGLRNAGKAIAVGASLLPIGRGAKAASMVAKRAALVAKNKKSAKNNMKIVNAVADLQQKTKAETIAKNSVKVKGAKEDSARKMINSESSAKTMTAKTGAAARNAAGKIEAKRQLPAKVVKIKSGKDVKSADSSKRKLASYTPNPGRLPNLIKIDSAKGNSVKKTAYRPNRRTSN